jgi:hypothetical protein
MAYRPIDVEVQSFESNIFCNMLIAGTGFKLSCRRQADGSAICSTWKQLSDGPSRPTDDMRRFAEGVAEVAFLGALRKKVS